MWKILIKGFYTCLKSLESIREMYIENQANKQKNHVNISSRKKNNKKTITKNVIAIFLLG